MVGLAVDTGSSTELVDGEGLIDVGASRSWDMTRSRPDRDFRNRTGPDRIGTPDPVDRTGPDRIPDQDIDFF